MKSKHSPLQRLLTGGAAVSGIFLLLSLIVSVSAFVLFSDGQIDRILFFPGARTSRVSGEVRRLPQQDDMRADVQLLLREIMLGPTDIQHGRLVPRDTTIRSVIVRDDKAFVDFSEGIVFEAPDQQLALEEVFDVLRRTIRYNFRRIDRVIFTVNGQLPSQPYFQIPPPSEGESLSAR